MNSSEVSRVSCWCRPTETAFSTFLTEPTESCFSENRSLRIAPGRAATTPMESQYCCRIQTRRLMEHSFALSLEPTGCLHPTTHSLSCSSFPHVMCVRSLTWYRRPLKWVNDSLTARTPEYPAVLGLSAHWISRPVKPSGNTIKQLASQTVEHFPRMAGSSSSVRTAVCSPP